MTTGKATASEIENHWTYRELLQCTLFMDLAAVEIWKYRVTSIPPDNAQSMKF